MVQVIQKPAAADPGMMQNVIVPANVGKTWAPAMDMLDPQAYAVNKYGETEAITQPLYSYVSYPAAGPTQPLQFFGFSVAGTVTAEDTNMALQGQLQQGQNFLLMGVGVDYLPGTAPGRFGAQSANNQINDIYAILRRGVLTITIGTKPYLQVAPLLQLPVRSHINGVAAVADATTAGANLQTVIAAGFADGPVFTPEPLLIPSGQGFTATLSWPAGQIAIPSADAAARIGLQFYGTLFRGVQ